MNQSNQPTQKFKKSTKQILLLSPQKSNLTLPLSQLSTLYPQFQINTKATYYPYNNKYDDYGWGCAWRAIQTVLSSYQIQYDFKQLIDKYKNKDKLLQIYFKRNKNNKILQTKNEQIKTHKWSPQQNQNCWAQPFISSLICKDHNLQTQLILVNGYPKAYAPQFVFEKVINFQNFWIFIKTKLPYSCIMIDDGYLALSIIGYRQGIQQQKHLLLADPHIISNYNQQNKYIGIYQVVLDKNGKQVENDVDNQKQKWYPYGSYESIKFQEKKWMAMAVINK